MATFRSVEDVSFVFGWRGQVSPGGCHFVIIPTPPAAQKLAVVFDSSDGELGAFAFDVSRIGAARYGCRCVEIPHCRLSAMERSTFSS